jgi:hypothetical protein
MYRTAAAIVPTWAASLGVVNSRHYAQLGRREDFRKVRQLIARAREK